MAVQTEMKLHELDPLKQKLATASDEINVALDTIQKKINAKQLGVDAFLTRRYLVYEETQPDDGYRDVSFEELGYGKDDDGTWGLVVRRWEGREKLDRDGDWETDTGSYIWVRPLLRAPRQVRADAIEHIPTLIEEIHAAAKNLLDKVEKAKQLAKSLE